MVKKCAFEFEKTYTVRYGSLKKLHTVTTLDVDVGDGTEVFINIDKSQEWLVKAVTSGDKGNKRRALKRVTVLDKLRQALVGAVKVNRELIETGRQAPEDDDADDPMNALDALPDDGRPKKRGTKYTSTRAKAVVTTVEMPAREPNKHPSCTQARTVRVYPASTSTLYLSEHDLEWFLDWVWDEMETAGVPVEPAEDLPPNCAAPGVHIRWDWDSATKWEAIVLEGPHQGAVIKSCIQTMTVAQWNTVASARGYSVAFADASRDDLTQATLDFLEQRMVGLVGEPNN